VPGVSFHKKAFSLHAYLDPAIGQNGNIYFLPDVAAGYGLLHNMLTISGGWQALLRQNTYEQLSTENPYMLNTYSVLQTRSDEVFVNADVAIGHHLTLSGRISWWAYDNLPVFLNNFGDQRKFDVAYDTKLNATSLLGAIRYQVANTLSVGFNASFYNFTNGSYKYVWNEPSVRFKGDLMFRPLRSLTVTAYLSALEDIYALDANNDIQKLKSIFDIGANAEYDIIPRLSVFAQTTNLLNDKYQRWLGYQAYGINVYGGLRLKF
jgi:outer membrane receptor protein involved in Fe transport